MSAIGGSGSISVTPPVSTGGAGSTTPTAPAAGGATAITLAAGGPFAGDAAFAEVAQGTRTFGVGERGAHVKTFEAALEDLGYALGRNQVPNDRFTRTTASALARFQRDQGLPQTGELDQASLAALDAAIAAGGATGVGGVTGPGAADPLAGTTYIDRSTFANLNRQTWARDNVELEAAWGVTGIEGKALVDLLRTERGGRPVFERLARNADSEAFSIGYGVDEMPWDERSHALREENPHVWLTIESGRFEPGGDGERRLSVGTDIMDDVYYDTADYTLLDNQMSLRGRIRWDTADTVRRLLIGAKFGSHVDDNGIKTADKIDIRRDMPQADAVSTLHEAVRGGRNSWDGEAALPIAAVYERLADAGKLPDIGPHEDVLLLEPKAFVRSVRSRFHLNEARLSNVAQLYDQGGAKRLESTLPLVDAALARPDLSRGDRRSLEAFAEKAKGTLDGSLIASRAADALKALDPSFDATPDAVRALMPSERPAVPTTQLELDKQKAVADTVSALYHELGAELGELSRSIVERPGGRAREAADFFVTWQKREGGADLARVTTPDRFVALHQEMLAKPDAELQKALDAYNAFGAARLAANDEAFEGFRPASLENFRLVSDALRGQALEIGGRQLEAAGSAAEGLWFDVARQFYVPAARRAGGNFLIDTMDYVEAIDAKDWDAIPEADRRADKPLPRDKIFNASMINEVQIELGHEEPYVARLRELKGAINGDRASMVMRWADDVKHPALGGGADAAAYQRVLAAVQGMDDATIAGTLDSLNGFLAKQGSALTPLTAADLRALDPALLTIEARDRPVRTDPTTERSYEGAKWVFSRYTGTLAEMAAMKGRRVLRELERAGGPADLGWGETAASKGDTALALLREGPR